MNMALELPVDTTSYDVLLMRTRMRLPLGDGTELLPSITSVRLRLPPRSVQKLSQGPWFFVPGFTYMSSRSKSL
jgi:hypothetical protein